MTNPALTLLVIALLAGVIILFLRWLLIITEGVFLGRRVVVWLYDITAGRYDEIKEFDPATERAFVIRPLLRRLEPWPAPWVLDVATGTGRLPSFLLLEPDFHGRVVGLDASAGMLAFARQKLTPYGNRAALIRQLAQSLPFADESLAAVTCLESLEFLPDEMDALQEMVRVLEPGGVLLVTRRCGPEAGQFLGRHHSREEFELLLTDLGVTELQTQPWQVEYNLVWGVRAED